jgi:hypothetical protein
MITKFPNTILSGKILTVVFSFSHPFLAKKRMNHIHNSTLENIGLTLLITPLTLFPLILLFLVRLGGYIKYEFVHLLFLQVHRETDRFFAVSGVHLP